MTHNQINYWNLVENKRHNRVEEIETNRHNTSVEGETHRHNVVTEGIDLGKLNETIRHNKVSEGLEGEKINLGYAQLGETKRHNLATEGESQRHNIANERIDLGKLNQGWSSIDESIRHNQATESLTSQQQAIQRELNDSQIALNDVRATWEGLTQSAHVELTYQEKAKMKAELDRIQQEITKAKIEGGTKTSQEIRSWINDITKWVDNLIPG